MWVLNDGQTHGLYNAGYLPGRSGEVLNPLYYAKLQLNGHDRFSQRYGSYFDKVQPFQTTKTAPLTGINLYSFALSPAEHQPSGTCNFSRIDNATLVIVTKKLSPYPTTVSNALLIQQFANVTDEATVASTASRLTTLRIFAENYNVLRIMSGMFKNHPCRTASCCRLSNSLASGSAVRKNTRGFATRFVAGTPDHVVLYHVTICRRGHNEATQGDPQGCRRYHQELPPTRGGDEDDDDDDDDDGSQRLLKRACDVDIDVVRKVQSGRFRKVPEFLGVAWHTATSSFDLHACVVQLLSCKHRVCRAHAMHDEQRRKQQNDI